MTMTMIKKGQCGSSWRRSGVGGPTQKLRGAPSLKRQQQPGAIESKRSGEGVGHGSVGGLSERREGGVCEKRRRDVRQRRFRFRLRCSTRPVLDETCRRSALGNATGHEFPSSTQHAHTVLGGGRTPPCLTQCKLWLSRPYFIGRQ